MTASSTRGARPRVRAIALITTGAVVAALVCGGCSTPKATSVKPDPSVTIEATTPAGARAKQTLDMLNSDSPIRSAAVSMIAASGVVKIVEPIMENLWWDRPYTLSAVDYPDGRAVLHLVNGFGALQNISIHTDDAGLIDRFDADVSAPVINSWQDIDAQLDRSHARYAYQIAKVNDGKCERLAGTNTTQSLPIASIFKLYVLDAVADAVRAGTMSWDEQLTITSKVKAVEFAGLEEFPLGAKVSVREAAQQMISKSYNTATDLLIDRVGIAAVERALVTAGHHDPQSMTPLPTMYELFSIGWGEPDLRQQWKDAVATGSPQARARLLERVSAAPYQPDLQRSHTPASTYGVEWYGTAEDICRVHTAVQMGAVGAAAPIRDIMSATRGIDLDPQQWPYVGAKGGNLPGDLIFSWYAVDRGGQAWVISFQVNWPVFHGLSAWKWLLSIAKQAFVLAAKPA
jgi:beta-lactamase class A